MICWQTNGVCWLHLAIHLDLMTFTIAPIIKENLGTNLVKQLNINIYMHFLIWINIMCTRNYIIYYLMHHLMIDLTFHCEDTLSFTFRTASHLLCTSRITGYLRSICAKYMTSFPLHETAVIIENKTWFVLIAIRLINNLSALFILNCEFMYCVGRWEYSH